MGFRIEAPKQDGNARFNTLKVNLNENNSATRTVVSDEEGNFYYGAGGSGGTGGTNGTSGTSGVDGSSGTSGESGTSGTSGISGTGFNTIADPLQGRILLSDGSTNSASASLNLFYDTGSSIFQVTGSISSTQGFTGSLQGTSSWANNAISSSYPIAVTGSTLYSVNPSAGNNFNTNQNIFLGEGSGQDSQYTTFAVSLGYQAGYQSNFSQSYSDDGGDFTASVNFIGHQAGYQISQSSNSNFIGYQAGYQTIFSNSSNFIGGSAGYLSKNGDNSNFIGRNAGFVSDGVRYSNLLGINAGQGSIDVLDSNFIGEDAGENSKNIQYSNFIGFQAGLQASSSIGSNFIGYSAGSDVTSSYSTLIGYRTGYNNSLNRSIGSNNVIIGSNITLEKDRKDSINLGGIIFATGSYSTTSGNPFSGSANGRIGINVVNPQYTLDVSGSLKVTSSVLFSGLTQVAQNNVVLVDISTGQLYYTASSGLVPTTAATASFISSSNVYGPYGFNSIQTASYALTASSADDFLVRGTLTAQTIVAQVITSSTEYVTGSTIFGSELSNTHQFTGSVFVTGSLLVNDSAVVLTNQTGSMSVATSSYALTASYIDATNVSGLFRIATGSVSASVNVTPESLFLINSGFTQYFNISSSGDTDIYSNLFIVRNFITKEPVLTVSQSIVQIATQSFDPLGNTLAGSIWFTSASMFVGLE